MKVRTKVNKDSIKDLQNTGELITEVLENKRTGGKDITRKRIVVKSLNEVTSTRSVVIRVSERSGIRI